MPFGTSYLVHFLFFLGTSLFHLQIISTFGKTVGSVGGRWLEKHSPRLFFISGASKIPNSR